MADFDVALAPFREMLTGRSLSQMSNEPLRAVVRSPLRLGSLSLAADATLEVQVLNRADDRDADGVFGAKDHIPYETQRAWLKYKLTAALDGKISPAALAAGVSDSVDLYDYRIHDATDSALGAFERDVASPRSILSIDDVRRLQPGEAVALERSGRFTATVTLAWADVISTLLSDVVDGFAPARPIALRLERKLKASARVRVDDELAVVISRTSEGRLRLSARRGASRDHRVGIDASIGASASAVKAVEEAIAPLFAAVTSVAIDAAERAARKFEVEPLTLEERDILDRLAAFFGVSSEEDRAAAIRRGIAGVKRELRARLEAALEWSAVAAFSWEYARLDEETAIADFVLHEEALLEHDYPLVIDGDFAQLAPALRTDLSKRTILGYMEERNQERETRGGFTLSFGKWKPLETTDRSQFRLRTRTALSGFRLVEARSTRAYEEKGLPQNDFEWAVDFRAVMNDYAADPDTSMFEYRLQYAVQFERANLREDDLERMLDFASMWGIVTASRDEYAGALGKRATLELQLLFDDRALEAALSGVTSSLPAWAESLACAMPWSSTFRERRAWRERAAIYGDAWKAWLDDDYAVASALRPRVASGLSLLENRGLPGSFAWIAGEGHPHLRQRLRRFIEGCRTLFSVMNDARSPAELTVIASDLDSFWTQRLYIAASGRFLLERALAAGARVRRSLRVNVDDESIVS